MNRFQRLAGVSKGQIRSFSQSIKDTDVLVCGFARTPIGKFNGGLASKTAPQLGAIAISEAIKRSGINKDLIEEAFMGNVVSAGVGQAPTRQAVIYAGLKLDTPSTTINKVCSTFLSTYCIVFIVLTRFVLPV
jgi:acetyl-CoA C-acetyltransferase